MASPFDIILPETLKLEGGYANLSGDTGGETYKGISRNNYPKWSGWSIVDLAKKTKPLKNNEIIKNVQLDNLVDQFYKTEFWNKIGGDQIKDIGIAQSIFDMAVNAGVTTAVRLMQRVLNANFKYTLETDGVIGPKTISAINSVNQSQLFNLYNTTRDSYYRAIGKPQFLKSWLSRIDNSKAFAQKQTTQKKTTVSNESGIIEITVIIVVVLLIIYYFKK